MSLKEPVVKQTIIVLPQDADEPAEISTFSRKWINRMNELVEMGLATEMEPAIEGATEFQFDRSLLRMPFYRKPRTWTEEQRDAARERLAGVREAVKASRKSSKADEGEDEEEEEEEAPRKAKKFAKQPVKQAKQVKKFGGPAKKSRQADDEDLDLEEDEELEEEPDIELEDDDEEVVVKKPAKKTKK